MQATRRANLEALSVIKIPELLSRLNHNGLEISKEWNAQRKDCQDTPSFVNVEMSHCTTTGIIVKMYGLDFSCLDFSGSSFNGVFLSGSSFEQSNLSGANLRGCNFSAHDMIYRKIHGFDLDESRTPHSVLRKCLDETNLLGASINKKYPDYLDFCPANLKRAVLSDAILSKVNFTGCDLTETTFRGSSIDGVNFKNARLCGADLRNVDFTKAHLEGANFTKANLTGANLSGLDLSNTTFDGATLNDTNLSHSNLQRSSFKNANLLNANIQCSRIIDTNFSNADLSGCYIYGVAVWDAVTYGSTQNNLVVSPDNSPTLVLDSIEVAQFVYLLLENQKIRTVIDTITSKVVLILGRFTEKRKCILDAIREELRTKGYCPVLFDFDGPSSRDTQETITTLARLSAMVIADITDAKSVPQELVSIVQDLPSVTVQPILQSGESPWGMYDHISRYPWVNTIIEYHDSESAASVVSAKIYEELK